MLVNILTVSLLGVSVSDFLAVVCVGRRRRYGSVTVVKTVCIQSNDAIGLREKVSGCSKISRRTVSSHLDRQCVILYRQRILDIAKTGFEVKTPMLNHGQHIERHAKGMLST